MMHRAVIYTGMIIVVSLCVGSAHAQEKHPRPIGLMGYLYGGHGLEKIDVTSGMMRSSSKTNPQVYGFEIGADVFGMAEKVLDKDIFGEWYATYKWGQNFESHETRYYEENIQKFALGYKFTPFITAEVYYKRKDQDIVITTVNVDLSLDYVGLMVGFRL
jgi:hypothetical protein